MDEYAVVVNTKRRCRIILEDNGNLTVEEFFKVGDTDRGNLVRVEGWVTLWTNTVAYVPAGKKA